MRTPYGNDMTGMALDGSVSNTRQERANVIGAVGREPDAKMLLQMLGIVPAPEFRATCKKHDHLMIPRSDGQGWQCSRCRAEQKAARLARKVQA